MRRTINSQRAYTVAPASLADPGRNSIASLSLASSRGRAHRGCGWSHSQRRILAAGSDQDHHPVTYLDSRAVERSCREQLARVLREPERQSVLVAEADHDVERQLSQAGLADEPRHLHGVDHRRRSGDPGRAARSDEQPDELRFDGVEPGRGRRRALHDQRSSRPGLRDRRGDRQHHLELHTVVRRRDPQQRARLQPRQRRASAGCRGRRGQGLLRPAGRPRDRARPGLRAGSLGDLGRVVPEQREGLQRSDLRQRLGPRR